MKLCTNCQISRESPGYNLFCPKCIFCGARIIQAFGKLQIPASDCAQYRRESLARWVSFGHSEAEIRRLAKGPLALGPEPSLESENPIPKKRR